jgi:hypothetical protein
MKRVTANGKEHQLPDGVLTYAKACALGGVDPLHEPTVTYRHSSGTGGELSPGDRIVASEGLVLEVRRTDKA